MPPEISNSGKLESPPPAVLERSKTEAHRHDNVLAEDAAQIFDDRIPLQQKVNVPSLNDYNL